MINLQYVGEETKYPVSFRKVSNHVVQVTGDLPVKLNGFTLSRIIEDDWHPDYSGFNTVYRQIEGGVQFSDDNSVYVEPIIPKPEEPEPYVPSLDEVKEAKISEMNSIQQTVIHNGIDVALTDGTVEHFTLTANDQISLMGLQTQVVQGAEQIPWHTSDSMEHCKYYSNADMKLIVEKAMEYVSFHVTYFRDLRIYISNLESEELVSEAVYGMRIPEEYQSEILADMYAVMEE